MLDVKKQLTGSDNYKILLSACAIFIRGQLSSIRLSCASDSKEKKPNGREVYKQINISKAL